jgi:hypothetical protein
MNDKCTAGKAAKLCRSRSNARSNSAKRGEAYHRFRRAIAYVNTGKFRLKTEAEQLSGTSARG